ncbi:hypothetical protein HPB47_018662 [Ixodes persulcatus]|uniref:Uncharacterized protein n=1 Tax=Ixodes persulcatus TaxID=34615 RepID=A0AC60QNP0_IXOPE|nr:hypothetical protein HPB47_018662 [Ixodes persulcatus]
MRKTGKTKLLSDDSSSNPDSISDSDPEDLKRRAPTKRTYPISTTEEDNSGGSTSAVPAPPERRTKKSQKTQNGKTPTLQPTQGKDKTVMTKQAEQTPQEASLREQMGLAQHIFLQAFAGVGAPMEAHYRDALVDSFQAVATQLLEENAFLKGRLIISTVNATPNKMPPTKAALLVYPTKPKKNEEHRQVLQSLHSAFTPTDIGLEAPERCSASPTCTECGGKHRGTECSQTRERLCLACEEHLQPQAGDDKLNHSALDPSCPTYLWHIERLKEKINYL